MKVTQAVLGQNKTTIFPFQPHITFLKKDQMAIIYIPLERKFYALFNGVYGFGI